MSDDEIMNEAPPAVEESQAEPVQQESEPQQQAETNEPAQEQNEQVPPAGEEQNSASEEPEANEEEENPPAQNVEPDYKKFYETMMSPIKANGKTIQLKDPSEAIRLMQMGANYTHKMQSLAPYRKKMAMLQNAGLFEEDKINNLIDLAQGKPEAIAQFLKDHKIDPLDLDMSDTAPKYVPGNHQVSDQEIAIQGILEDLRSTPDGQDTLKEIGNWDQASLAQIWNSPDILSVIHHQRNTGVFKTITEEMNRLRTLGQIPDNMSFLDAYQQVGTYLLQQKAQMQQMQRVQGLPKGTLKQPQTNNAQVKAAAPSGRSKKTNVNFVDPFSLSDEEFDKQFKDYS
jgi:hypothetical protein